MGQPWRRWLEFLFILGVFALGFGAGMIHGFNRGYDEGLIDGKASIKRNPT